MTTEDGSDVLPSEWSFDEFNAMNIEKYNAYTVVSAELAES